MHQNWKFFNLFKNFKLFDSTEKILGESWKNFSQKFPIYIEIFFYRTNILRRININLLWGCFQIT